MNAIMTNVGKTDKAIRIALGLVLFVTFFAMKSWLWLSGVAILVSGILDFCPIYKIFGISSCKSPEKWWK